MSTAQKSVQKYHKGTDSQFVIKHNANNVFVIDHCTIAANKPKQVYLLMKDIITILITHRSNIECRTFKHNNQAPS